MLLNELCYITLYEDRITESWKGITVEKIRNVVMIVAGLVAAEDPSAGKRLFCAFDSVYCCPKAF
jgi:hypothetical protein